MCRCSFTHRAQNQPHIHRVFRITTWSKHSLDSDIPIGKTISVLLTSIRACLMHSFLPDSCPELCSVLNRTLWSKTTTGSLLGHQRCHHTSQLSSRGASAASDASAGACGGRTCCTSSWSCTCLSLTSLSLTLRACGSSFCATTFRTALCKEVLTSSRQTKPFGTLM